MRVAVLIPALDEEASLPKVLAAVPVDLGATVVVVDNGSRDRTAEVARVHGAVVLEEPRRGYGAACLRGIAWLASLPSPPDVLVVLDADYSDDPGQMRRLIGPVEAGEADMVVGSRVLGRAERGALTPPQRLGNWLAAEVIGRRHGQEFTDLGPFRAVRFPALLGLGMEDRTWGWNVEMHLKALKAGWRVVEVPVDYRRRIGRSKISGTVTGVARAGARILWALHHYR